MTLQKQSYLHTERKLKGPEKEKHKPLPLPHSSIPLLTEISWDRIDVTSEKMHLRRAMVIPVLPDQTVRVQTIAVAVVIE
jgi:hypothetical protein